MSYVAVYLCLRGVTPLGTFFAFANTMHAHTLCCEQAHVLRQIHIHIYKGTVALKLHPRREKIIF